MRIESPLLLFANKSNSLMKGADLYDHNSKTKNYAKRFCYEGLP